MTYEIMKIILRIDTFAWSEDNMEEKVSYGTEAYGV
jgi:hypothetical protein